MSRSRRWLLGCWLAVLLAPSSAFAGGAVIDAGGGAGVLVYHLEDSIGEDTREDGSGAATYTGSVTLGGASARVDTRVLDGPSGASVIANGSSDAVTVPNVSQAHANQFRSITSTQTVPLRISGSITEIGDPFLGIVRVRLQVRTAAGFIWSNNEFTLSGPFNFTGDVPPDGTANLDVHSECAASNQDSIPGDCDTDWNVRLDVGTPPDVPTVITQAPPPTTASGAATFSFESTTTPLPAGHFECRVDPAPATAFTSCTSPHQLAGLADGTHRFEVRYDPDDTDPGATAAHEWTVDSTLPSVSIDSGPSGSANPPDAQFTFHADEPSATFRCRVDGGAVAPCQSPFALSGLAPGTHTFAVEAVDTTGNASTPATRSWEVGCDDVQVGVVQAQGCFRETAPGSGVFETSGVAWVGGFEVRPRPGGTLVLDTTQPAVATGGSGVDVVMKGELVDLPVARLPVSQSSATIEVGQVGTLERRLWSKLPVQASLKVTWDASGEGAGLEGKLDLDRLGGPIGAVVGKAGGEFKARVENGRGFILDRFEARIDELSITPRSFPSGRQLKLKALLVRYERIDGVDLLLGQGGIQLPLARGPLDVIGRVRFADGVPSGGGLGVDGINQRLGSTPLFLQRIGGDLNFVPEFGFGVNIGASFGPKVNGKELFSLDGMLEGGSLVRQCPAGTLNPTKVTGAAKLRPLEPFIAQNLVKADLKLVTCISNGTGLSDDGIQTSMTFKFELPTFDTSYESVSSGIITSTGVALEGAATVRVAGLPTLRGQAIIGDEGVSACGSLGIVQAGVSMRWNQPPEVFSGCGLTPFRPTFGAGASQARALTANGTVRVPAGLPVAGFRIPGSRGAPRVELRGPDGARLTSPAGGRPLRTRRGIIAPVPGENATYVFVAKPAAGGWTVRGLDGARLGRLTVARGLPTARVKARIKRAKTKLRVTWTARRITGQRLVFLLRTDGSLRRLATSSSSRGRFTFASPAGVKGTVIARVLQDGVPRAILRVARV